MQATAKTDEELLETVNRLERVRELRVAKATGGRRWRPLRHQIPPHQIEEDVDWYLWLTLAGRGAGKTDSCAAYFDQFMRLYPKARGGIVAPTLGDAAEACVYGVSGLIAHNPAIKVRSRAGGTYVHWPNDSVAKLFGAYTKEDVERLRAGGNRHIYWAEELAAWRNLKEAWENMELGLRLGIHPRVIASTTPKTRPYLKRLMNAPDTRLVRATIHDNPHLPDIQKQRLVERYRGTRLERQELLGEYIDDVEGALWTYETLQSCRVTVDQMPDLVRVIEGVDPSGGDEDGNDEQGIVIVGKGVDGDYYVLADRSCKLSPDGWGKRSVAGAVEFGCDKIVCEANFGGDMVIATVRVAAAAMGVSDQVTAKKISASRGKAARAEPIAALYEQGRFHHVVEVGEPDEYELLESQMRNWTSDSGWSPDRMDALVWAATELVEGHTPRPMRVLQAKGRIKTQHDRFAPGF